MALAFLARHHPATAALGVAASLERSTSPGAEGMKPPRRMASAEAATARNTLSRSPSVCAADRKRVPVSGMTSEETNGAEAWLRFGPVSS